MNYLNTFIQVAPDTAAKQGTVPVPKAGKATVAVLEYELISAAPYTHTQEEVLFTVHCQRQGIAAKDLKARRKTLWQEFFAQPRACLRASPLPKTYGWGLHFDPKGKVALVAVESAEYKRLAASQAIEQTRAMRSRRA